MVQNGANPSGFVLTFDSVLRRSHLVEPGLMLTEVDDSAPGVLTPNAPTVARF